MYPLTTICDGPRVIHLALVHRQMKTRSDCNFEIARRYVEKPNIQAHRKVIEVLLRACGASKARAQRQCGADYVSMNESSSWHTAIDSAQRSRGTKAMVLAQSASLVFSSNLKCFVVALTALRTKPLSKWRLFYIQKVLSKASTFL